jgi:flagellar biosynthetic protein FliP
MPAMELGPLGGLPNPTAAGNTWPLVQWVLAISVLAVAPAVMVMVTSFTRIIVVLNLLRQALATQQAPPNQVLLGLALFMTLAVMSPVISDVYTQAVSPLMAGRIDQPAAFEIGKDRVRAFMIDQIEGWGNSEDVYLFLSDDIARRNEVKWKDVPTTALIPAFVVSELKVAFTIGFRIFLPFLIIDMLVASVLTSMGMLMLPPVLVSLPFKLLLFVLVDGWHLVVGTLMRSFG